MTRQQHELGHKAAEEHAMQRSCAKCRAAGRHVQARGHKGSNFHFGQASFGGAFPFRRSYLIIHLQFVFEDKF
jgi:hypothetical protein